MTVHPEGGGSLLEQVKALANLLEYSAPILDELQSEVSARTASLELLAAQIKEQEGRAKEASAVASLQR
jgi:hypothetical protein